MKVVKNTFIVLLVTFFVTGLSSFTNKEQQTKPKKPNVIILFADQHHKKVMGFEGHPDVMTPNLDKLAKEAVVFDRAYCTTGICAPSRSSLMSGLYSRTLGLLSNGEETEVMREVVSLATVFKQNNYNTYAFGKRHTSQAVDEGWDVQRSHLCNETPGNSYTEWVEKMGYGKEFAKDWAAEFGKGSGCSSYANEKLPIADLGTRVSELPENMTMEAFTTQLTVQMIKDQAKSDKPFFCWATFYRPHQPYTPLKKYMDMYDVADWGNGRKNGGSIKKPASLYESKTNIPPMMQSIRDGGNKVWNVDKAYADEQLWRNYIGAYYALVTEVDHRVGQILQALDEAGITEETIVIYTSDHGDFVGNHGMVEKAAAGQNVYEDILNIPLIIRYPGNKENGKHIGELVSLVDIYPTLVELLGLKMPTLKNPLQGESMVQTLLSGKPMEREYFVSESWSQATVITKDQKLGIMLDPTALHKNWDFRAYGDMFFDRKKDSLEVDNRIKDSAYQKDIAKLLGYYNEFVSNTPSTGKDEMINEKSNKVQKPISLAVAGMSHGHISFILKRPDKGDFKLVGVCESNQELLTSLSEKYQLKPEIQYTELEKMLDEVKPEAVVAFGSVFDHLAVVEACAPRHIDVMVEKPLAVNMIHANRMAQLAKQYNIQLLTDYETSWYPTTAQTMKMVLDDNFVGPLRKVVFHDGHKGPKEIGCDKYFLEWLTDPILNGGGAIVDFGCYGANLMTVLTKGEKPISVTAVTRQFKPEIYPKVDDDATIIVSYPQWQCIIQASWNWPFNRKDMEVYGTTGYVIADNKNDLRIRNSGMKAEEGQQITANMVAVYEDPFAYFADVIHKKIQVEPFGLYSLENNVRVVEILDAARQSAKTGETVVFK